MNNFDRFQRLQHKRMVAQEENNANFIFDGYPSVRIHCGENSRIAAVVNQQEKDYAYVYTKLREPIEIGSIWQAKDLHLLITEEITVIKNVKWHKYKALLANVEFENVWGWWKGPEASYVNTTLQEKVIIQSLQKPLLILPNGFLDFEDKVVINDRAWLVQEYDSISTPGLTYYSLVASNIDKTNETHSTSNYIVHKNIPTYDVVITPVTHDNITVTSHNVPISVLTYNGYFRHDNKITIQKHNSNEVIFTIPFGVNEVTINTKDNNDNIITHIYRVE